MIYRITWAYGGRELVWADSEQEAENNAVGVRWTSMDTIAAVEDVTEEIEATIDQAISTEYSFQCMEGSIMTDSDVEAVKERIYKRFEEYSKF